MKVEELIIDGFKSYATRTVISHWDPQFNAITGLNGSGKSNILDAICFVLGISSMATVRASNLQDLIYKRGQAGVTKASVTIVFDNTDRNNSPIGFETYSKISVTRQVMLGGTSKYLINGHRAQQQTVLHLFQSVQLNINNPNFLIMQGKITKVLNMKPKEILALIEEAAGTRMFEDRRQKAEKTMTKKESKLVEITSILQEEIEPKLEKLRGEKRAFLEFQEIQTDLETTQRIVDAFEYYMYVTKYQNVQKITTTQQSTLEEYSKSMETLKRELANLNEDLAEMEIKREKSLDKEGAFLKLEKKEQAINNDISRIHTTISIKEDDMKEQDTRLLELQKDLDKLKGALEFKSESFKEKKLEYDQAQNKMNNLKKKHAEKEALLSSLTTGISLTSGEQGGYMAQISSTKKDLNDCVISIKSAEMKISRLENELVKNQPRLEQAKLEKAKLAEDIEQLKKQKKYLEAKLADAGFNLLDLKQLKEREVSLRDEIYKISNEVEQWKRKLYNIDFTYSSPSPNFDSNSVKGVAATLFVINDENLNAANALQVCAGGRLFNVVVDNEKTASQLLERGRLRKRVTIIPLNKIAARKLREDTVKFAKQLATSPENVELALNLIGYEAEVAKALEFIFGTSLICKDSDTAKIVTFHPQIRTRSITLQGDVYDPEGTLSGGSRGGNSSLLLDIQKYNKSAKQLNLLQKEISIVHDNIKTFEKKSTVTRELQDSLNVCDYKLQLAEKENQSNLATQILNRKQEILKEIANFKKDITSKMQEKDHLEAKMGEIQKEIDDFAKDKGSKLNELKQQVSTLTSEVDRYKVIYENLYDEYQNLELERDQLISEINQSKESEGTIRNNLEQLKKDLTQLKSSMDGLQEKGLLITEELEHERSRLLEMDNEIKELQLSVRNKTKSYNTIELEHQKLTNEHEKFRHDIGSIRERIQKLKENNDWLTDDNYVSSIVEQNQNIDLDEYKKRSRQLEEKFNGLRRRVNPNIMSMIDSVEKKEGALKTMIRTIEKDKQKIQETVEKLNEYKKDALIKTWEKVSVDFGQIFAELLPNSFAKLVTLENKEITEGLEVKVKLGSIWKEGLVELSGGQRSLIALSLILALLQFKPAPMYILDEVDAALDLSHTQNIGHLIKTRFKGSQFIVVSLKEGMFSNANRVFRTRFQEGTSVVSIMN
ncbi:condensin subunit SMC2 SCDLUD_002467 [Saccharomycodes ludwigii]|uniref:condensin subunit SMC2 n=1 Tax=Saccharomycodes ludwigii TaxID=36035 RepID=UPI001E85F411|nr:hypothetical protein SCDLUD_002467 [Saccharomycodes ludwigii]KAH3901002.1 hypothetical protein SCDLUD_002467 [Saccharomycodes ludwigii]